MPHAPLPIRQHIIASVDERAIVVCFLDFQVIAPPDAKKTYPVVDLRSSWFAKAASAKP